MLKRFNANYMALFLLVDVVLVQLALEVAMALRYSIPLSDLLAVWPQIEVQNLRLALHLAFGVLNLVFLINMSVYNPRKVVRWVNELQRVVTATTLTSLSLTGMLYLINLNLPRLGFLYFYILSTASLIGYRWLLRVVHRLRQDHPDMLTRVLVVGANKIGGDVIDEFRRQRLPGLKVVGVLDPNPDLVGTGLRDVPVIGCLSNIREVITAYRVDQVVVALPLHAHQELANLVSVLYEMPVDVHVVPDFFDLAFHNATVGNLGSILLIGLRDPAIDGVQRMVKRLMDMALSLIGLIVFSPVFVAVAIAIKLEDGGPIFYRSQRVGENGRLFWMWKFRSMVPDAEGLRTVVLKHDEDGNPLHKTPDDPRVTRVGYVIRRTSIDELPQLFNVLKGEMSLVGPRPELPWLVASYQPWQRKRFAVPQGITGWWQVNGRSDKPLHLHTDQDLYYIQNYSVWLDLRILWMTVAALVSGKGAF